MINADRRWIGLYDKDQNGDTPRRSLDAKTFSLIAPDGTAFADKLSPEGFAGAMRQLIETIKERSDLTSLIERNAKTLERLKADRPALKTAKGLHCADVLEQMVKERLATLSGEPSRH